MRWLKTYPQKLERLGTVSSGSTTWTGGDALGSTRLTLDDAGAVVGTTSYDAWGTPTYGTPAPFGFTGELHRQGLVYLRARWYDPTSGTFLTKDPFAGFPRQPYSLHPYQYAYSNPLRYTDPSGETPCEGHMGSDPTLGRHAAPPLGYCPDGTPMDMPDTSGGYEALISALNSIWQWANTRPAYCACRGTLPAAVSYSATAVLGTVTSPGTPTGTLITEEQIRRFGFPTTDWTETGRTTGPLREMIARKPPHPGGWTQVSHGNWWQRHFTQWRFERGFAVATGARGLSASFGYGMGVDAILQVGSDLLSSDCFTPLELAKRATVAAGTSIAATAAGAVVTVFVAGAAASAPVWVPVGALAVGTGIVVSIGVGAYLSRDGGQKEWLLDAVTPLN